MSHEIVMSGRRAGSPRRRVLRLFSLAIVAALALAATPAARAASVIPILDSVVESGSPGVITASFGYVNPNSSTIGIALGASNFFSPPPALRGQPTSFLPGTNHSAFSVSFSSSSSLTWTLEGNTVTADSSWVGSSSTTTFSYQGRLENAGVPYAGTADFRFTVYTTLIGATPVGSTVAKSGVTVAGGLFTVALDFGDSVFDPAAVRYLQTEVRMPAWDGQGAEPAFTALSPRTPLTPSPMSIAATTTRPSNLYVPYSTTTSVVTGASGFLFVGPSASASFAYPIQVGTDSSNGNGAYLSAGGSWTNGSDRNSKTDFNAVDTRTILDKIAALPVTEWRYKGESAGVRHIGPMAQDFKAAFGLGYDERHIGTVDADGVALAAIQALNDKTRALQTEANRLRRENEALRARLDSLEAAARNGAAKP